MLQNATRTKGSILQYFRPSLRYHLSLRSLFCLFLSGRFTQVLLYRINVLGAAMHIWREKVTFGFKCRECFHFNIIFQLYKQSKKEGKDQESIQSSTTPDQGYQWESNKLTIKYHKREPRGQSFPSR